MKSSHSHNLLAKVLLIGACIAVLSYLFHPDVGQLALSFNGDPVAEPLVRFAAIPSFIIMLLLTGVIMVLVFLGVGMLMLMAGLAFTLILAAVFMPYFWPILLIVFVIIALMSAGTDRTIE